MSDNHKSSKFVGGLKAMGQSIKKSPQVMRKKIGHAAKKVREFGRGKHYSNLDDCEDNGWLHTDGDIMVGVPYHVKYIGSKEIDYIVGNSAANNQLALNVLHEVKAMDIKPISATLTIASGHIDLSRKENHEVLMRHSTTRIAYSTVDHGNPRLFCYVALPRNSKIALCHCFVTKNAKMSYALTFTCAQAFDSNYRQWKARNASTKALFSKASSNGDVEAVNPLKSPEVRRKVQAAQQHRAEEDAKKATEEAVAKKIASRDDDDDDDDSDEYDSDDEVDEAEQERRDFEAGYIQIGELPKEDDATIAQSAEEFFSRLKPASSEDCLLNIGVEPEHYNDAEEEDYDSDDDE